MKPLISTALCAAVTAASLAMAGCGARNSAEGTAVDSPKADINNFSIHETLKSASQSYRLIYNTGDTAYLTVSATIQWPEKLGDHQLTALQDSLIGTLGRTAPYGIDQAIAAYVTNPDMLESDAAKPDYAAAPVDSVPSTTEAMMAYELSTTARVLELTEQTVTYQVYNYAFTGGAHPNYTYSPFTYSLENASVITFDSLFLPDCKEKLLPVVEEAMANQMGVTGVTGLSRAGVFMDQMFLSTDVYISDGQIVFHYNPYEIGPYSLGTIDVAVAPFVVETMLTPQAKALLIN